MVGLRLLVPSIKVRILVPELKTEILSPRRPVRLAVRTPASQAGNTGSNPVRVTHPLEVLRGGIFLPGGIGGDGAFQSEGKAQIVY